MKAQKIIYGAAAGLLLLAWMCMQKNILLALGLLAAAGLLQKIGREIA